MRKLTKAQMLAMHGELIAQTGGANGVRDASLLDSALEQPFQTFGRKDLYPTFGRCRQFNQRRRTFAVDFSASNLKTGSQENCKEVKDDLGRS